MRITAAAKEATRTRIMDAGKRSFAERPFDDVTTRELATLAGVAAGTLFNYFPSKEALATELLDQALAEALEVAPEPRDRGDETLAEDLFGLTLSAVHAFSPLRRAVGPVLAASLGPYTDGAPASGDQVGASGRLRRRVLAAVSEVVAAHRVPFGDDPLTAHLFWSLFLGVLAFWVADRSPEQEDTLVLVDRAMQMFVSTLPEAPGDGNGSPWWSGTSGPEVFDA